MMVNGAAELPGGEGDECVDLVPIVLTVGESLQVDDEAGG